MTHHNSNTKNEHSCDSKVATDKGKKRRIKFHLPLQETTAGTECLCGHVIKKEKLIRPAEDQRPIEYVPCKTCVALREYASEFEKHKPLRLLSHAHRLAFQEGQ